MTFASLAGAALGLFLAIGLIELHCWWGKRRYTARRKQAMKDGTDPIFAYSDFMLSQGPSDLFKP